MMMDKALSNRMPTEDILEAVLKEPESKEYQDLRDRAAYIYVTGAFPSHLRKFFTTMLQMACSYTLKPVSLANRPGSIEVDSEIAKRLQLEAHPMIRKVRELMKHGFSIHLYRPEDVHRRPYTRVYMAKLVRDMQGDVRIARRLTVQNDGAVKEGWG